MVTTLLIGSYVSVTECFDRYPLLTLRLPIGLHRELYFSITLMLD